MAEKRMVINQKLIWTTKLAFLLGLPLLITACNTADKPFGKFGVVSGFMQLVLLVIGILLLVVGYRISQFVLHLAGFAFGAIAGITLVGRFMQGGGFFITLAGFVIGGLIGAALIQFLAEAGVFIVGAMAGWFLGSTLVGWLHLGSPAALIISGVLAVIGGIFMLRLFKTWLIGVTSLLGAILVARATSSGLLWVVVLFVAGLIIQSLFSRRWKR